MTLEQHVITSSCGEYARDVWLLPGPDDEVHPLCVFLDAEHYLRDMESVPVLVELQQSGAIPRLTCLFVSHVSGEARHSDYTCNDRYSRFLAEDVLAWARARNGRVRQAGNVICGLSLSGLAGAYVALHYPGVFSYSLCQSGSFWWLEGKDLFLPRTRARFWLSVGDEETQTGVSHPPTGMLQRISQVDGVKSAARRLESLGGTVRYNTYSGGHAAAPWREELVPALVWLIGTP